MHEIELVAIVNLYSMEFLWMFKSHKWEKEQEGCALLYVHLQLLALRKATKAHNFNFDKFDFTHMPSWQLILANIETR